MQPKLLFTVEFLSLIIWLALAGVLIVQSQSSSQLQPLTKAALQASNSEERWNGIFFQDQHVGYAVSRTTHDKSGAMLMEQRSVFQVATFGQLQKIVTASAALTNAENKLERFDFFMASGEVKISARGEVQGKHVVMEIDQAGETKKLNFDLDEPPHVSLSLEAVIRRTELQIGTEIKLPYFDPITLSQQTMTIRVTDSEILENGEEAWWLRSTYGDIETRSLVTTAGDILRQEGAMGISMHRMTPKEAQDVPTQKDPVDLIALSAVRLKGKLKKARQKRSLHLKVVGIPATKLRHAPPVQIIKDDTVRVDIPSLEQLPTLPVADPSQSEWLKSTLTIPAEHREIVDKAIELAGDSPDRLTAAKALNQFVFDYMEKIPSIGVPNGLESLRRGRGDCNEHTALFVSLARALKIPSRIAAGLVYSDRSGPIGSFYYHAWPEVLLGEDLWVPIDPTFGQFPADATHIKIVEGDLDRQIEIMGILGRISLELLEAR